MTIWVHTNGRPSNSAAELAKLNGFRRLRTGKFVQPTDFIINWGSTQPVVLPTTKLFLNDYQNVKSSSNKLTAFSCFAANNVKTVPWTADQAVVEEWSKDGATIIGRQTLTGHSGAGIIIMEKHEPIQPALLYTRYIFKEREYRVHVVNHSVVDTQKKIKDPDKDVHSWKVRSHANGFIFARGGIAPSAVRDDLAVAACAALGLDFGAVDIVEDKKGNFYVLEVNTAPGLEGQSITTYGEALRARCQA